MKAASMKKLAKILGWGVCVLIVIALGAYGVARAIAGRKYNQQWTTHEVSFPVPSPLSGAELEALRMERQGAAPIAMGDADLQSAALTRAIARGEHLVK